MLLAQDILLSAFNSYALCEDGKMAEFKKVVEDTAFNLLKLAVVKLPSDIKEALNRAYKEETSEAGRVQFEAILKDIELAEKDNTPLCQDTGIIIFYVKAGSKVKGLEAIEAALQNATRRATKEIPLRPNAVDPFTQKNSGDNTGQHIPYINWEITDSDYVEITAFPKGGGSENVCTIGMITPGEGVNGLKKFVIDAVIKAGAMPCPPTIVGVAAGGGSDISIKLAKASLLRPLNEPNPNPDLDRLEKELYEAANSTGIGPMGLGGKFTVLGVRIDYAHRHPASYPVAVAFQCWAARRSTARIHSDGTVEYLTHEVR
jgi:fumarate hydratase subunit alpha